jgi:hypothetical protein
MLRKLRRSSTKTVAQEIHSYLDKVRAADYPSDVKEDPPWGKEARDERLLGDEDRSARLEDGDHQVEVKGNELTARLSFQNTFAGTIAVENWLREQGFEDIAVEVDRVLEGLPARKEEVEPLLGLFGDVVPQAKPWETASLSKATDEQVVRWMFQTSEITEDFSSRFEGVDRKTLAGLIAAEAQSSWNAGQEVTNMVVQAATWLGGDLAALVRQAWDRSSQWELRAAVVHALAASLPPDEAFARGKEWVMSADNPQEAFHRLGALTPLSDPRLSGLVEEVWRNAAKADVLNVATPADMLTASGADRETLWSWIEGGELPLARVAVRVLRRYCARGAPNAYERTDRLALAKLLDHYRTYETQADQLRLVDEILQHPTALVTDADGI